MYKQLLIGPSFSVKAPPAYIHDYPIFVTVYRKIPVISSGLIKLCKGILISKRNISVLKRKCYFSQCSVALCNCCKAAVARLYREGGMTGTTFCHQTQFAQTGGPITGWAYKWEGSSTGILRFITQLDMVNY